MYSWFRDWTFKVLGLFNNLEIFNVDLNVFEITKESCTYRDKEEKVMT